MMSQIGRIRKVFNDEEDNKTKLRSHSKEDLTQSDKQEDTKNVSFNNLEVHRSKDKKESVKSQIINVDDLSEVRHRESMENNLNKHLEEVVVATKMKEKETITDEKHVNIPQTPEKSNIIPKVENKIKAKSPLIEEKEEEHTYLIQKEDTIKIDSDNDKTEDIGYTITMHEVELWIHAIFEMIGTALLMIIIYISQGDLMKLVTGLWCILIIFGGLSGGCFNPLTAFSMLLPHELNSDWLWKLCLYWSFHFFGSWLGGVLCQTFMLNFKYAAVTPDVPFLYVLLSEFLLAGFLCLGVQFIIVSNKTLKKTDKIIKYGLICSLYCIVLYAGTGTFTNPAIYLVINYMHYDISSRVLFWKYLFIFITQLLGSAGFTYFFKSYLETLFENLNMPYGDNEMPLDK